MAATSLAPSSAPRPSKRLPRPSTTTRRVLWNFAVPLAVIHLLALLALVPWFFSWTGVVLCLVGIYVYGGLGINLGYHRLLTHRSFECPLWLERFFVLVALCCLEDAPGTWVAIHRLHHNESDEEDDPHTPKAGFWWGHVGWLLFENREIRTFAAFDRYARDVLRDPFYMAIQRSLLMVWVYFAHAAIYFFGGLAYGRLTGGSWGEAAQFGSSLLVWGVLLRTVCVWHITWSVNSLTHLFGYRNYQTSEDSRNNWVVALVSNGEGWHNNHHGDPSSASNRHRWWEFDGIWLVILAMEKLGLARNVVRPRHLRPRNLAR